ncbi:TPA: terminase small subunit [Streptococcus pyogenes]|nr:terminase small subunit [Streptococcus pyogenes]
MDWRWRKIAYEELTEKQQRFVDKYITTFNATESAKQAGYSEKSAYSQGQRLLKNVEIQKAMKERFLEAKDTKGDRIQDVAETLEQDTSIARGEIQISEFKETDMLTGQAVIHTKREYTPSHEEQGRARDRIYKVNGAYSEKRELEHSGTVVFANEDNIPD